MPRTGTSSPSMRRTEHSDRENSDEEDALTPNVRDDLRTETGRNEYGEKKDESDHSFAEDKSSCSDDDSSFVGKIRSNFSGILSVLLPVRQSKSSGGITPVRKPLERRTEAKSISNEQQEASLSFDLRKRPHSPNVVETDVGHSDNRTYEMIRKRPRLRETDDTREEKSVRPTSETLRTQTTSSSKNSHRLNAMMSNSAFRKRMQQSRDGYAQKTLFGSSQLRSTTNRNETVASLARPSFNISVAKMSKSLSNGWIPPEYGGSPFYEGLTRFGGASSARTLGIQGPSRPPVTVLVKKSHASAKAQSLPDPATKPLTDPVPETHTSAMSYPSRRILEIVDEYTLKNASSKRGMSLSNMDIRTPRTLQMLNIIRSQQMERPEEKEPSPGPPTVPLMEYTLPSHVDSSISPVRKEEPKSTGGKQVTKRTRLHADPIKDRDESAVEPIQLPNLKLPPLGGLPKFDFTVPMKGPLLPAEKKFPSQMNNTMKSISSKSTVPASGENKKQEIERDTPTTPPSNLHKVRSYGFTSPMLLASASEVTDSGPAVPVPSIPLAREVTTFVFTSPKLLNGSSQIANPAPIVPKVTSTSQREMRKFVFDPPIVLGDATEPAEPVPPSVIMSFVFAAPEPLEVTNAPKARSFQELMAESASKWACDVCMIRNEPNQQKCIACETPKPVAVPAKKTEPFLPASGNNLTNTISGGFAAIVSAQSSRWECPACSVRNDSTAAVCVCCATEKPTGAN
uniref:RanBP2-type domain-containing protein n=1 Tax=Anopheles culicifacies TaxID=139723 RepID=A0A182M8A2_9DIPT